MNTKMSPAMDETSGKKSSTSVWIILAIVLVLLLVGTPICICGGCLWFGASQVSDIIEEASEYTQSTEPYQTAMRRASENETVVAELGEPLEGSPFAIGTIEDAEEDGYCEFFLNVSGPFGDGILEVEGVKRDGQWTYSMMQIEIDGEIIDLNQSSDDEPIEEQTEIGGPNAEQSESQEADNEASGENESQ